MSFLSEFNSCHQPSGCGGMAAKQRVVAKETAAVGWATGTTAAKAAAWTMHYVRTALHTWTMRERHSAEPLAAAAARGSLRLGVYF